LDWFFGDWPFYVSGLLIGVFPFLTLYFLNKEFGISSSFRNICHYFPTAKKIEYFNFNLKDSIWNLKFALGVILAGIVSQFSFDIQSNETFTEISKIELQEYGLNTVSGYVPLDLFDASLGSILILIIAGLFIGFGTRWADGCTSGHAITGLAKGQISSLVAVIGFFLGGVLASYFILPLLLKALL
jgi:uncharacterized protein